MRFLYAFIIKKITIIIFIFSFAFCAGAEETNLSFPKLVNLNSNLEFIFSKMKKAGSDESQNIARSIWVKGYVDNYKNSADENIILKSNRTGMYAGANLLTGKNTILGVFGGYNLNSFFLDGQDSQDDMSEFELGVYRAQFGEMFNTRTIIGYAHDSFKFNDYQKNPASHNAKLGFDLELLIPITQSIDLKPFAQVQGLGAYNAKTDITSSSVLLSGISYRAQTLAGLRLADDKNNFNWHLGVFIGYLFNGRVDFDKDKTGIDANPSLSTGGAVNPNVSVKNPLEFKSEQDIIYGFSAGAEYISTKMASLYVEGGYKKTADYNEIFIGGGIRLVLGGKKSEPKPKADKDAPANGNAKEEKPNSSNPADAADNGNMAEKLQAAINGDEAARNLGNTKEESLINREKEAALPASLAQYAPYNERKTDNLFDSSTITDTSNQMRTDNSDVYELSLSDEEQSAQKMKEDKKRYVNLIKSFILSVAVFKTGGYELTPEAKQEIKALADNIKKYHYEKITVEGHSDNSGKPEDNQKLSVLRARSVFGELFLNGIPLEKLEYVGMGASMPIASNNTPDGRARNRRVEIFVE